MKLTLAEWQRICVALERARLVERERQETGTPEARKVAFLESGRFQALAEKIEREALG